MLTSRQGIRTLAALGAVLALTRTGPGIANANQGGVPAIPLNTEQAGSNTGASGFFTYTISGDQFCYTLSVRDLSAPATAAHVHLAPRHVAGPLVIPLTVGSGTSAHRRHVHDRRLDGARGRDRESALLLRQRAHADVPGRGDPRATEVEARTTRLSPLRLTVPAERAHLAEPLDVKLCGVMRRAFAVSRWVG